MTDHIWNTYMVICMSSIYGLHAYDHMCANHIWASLIYGQSYMVDPYMGSYIYMYTAMLSYRMYLCITLTKTLTHIFWRPYMHSNPLPWPILDLNHIWSVIYGQPYVSAYMDPFRKDHIWDHIFTCTPQCYRIVCIYVLHLLKPSPISFGDLTCTQTLYHDPF